MAIHFLKRIEDKARDFIQSVDYLIYLLINQFKWKSFPKEIKKVIVVDLLNIGDVLVTTPVLKALKETYPKASIDMLVNERMTQILSQNRVINEVIPHKSFNQTLKTVRANSYDLGIILHPGSLKVSLLLLRGKVKYRIGCTKAGITYGKGFFLNKKIFPNNAWQHKVEDNLDVIRSIGITPKDKTLEIHATPQAEQKIKKILGKKKHFLVGISAASKHWTQCWYPERWAEVANDYIKKHNATIIFIGLQDEMSQIEDIISRISKKENVINLVGKTSLHELIAVIKQLDLLITIDSSASHIASALNTPVLTLFGPTIPMFWGPTSRTSSYIWKEKEACVGCRRYHCVYNKGHECMKSISPQEVIAKAEKLLV